MFLEFRDLAGSARCRTRCGRQARVMEVGPVFTAVGTIVVVVILVPAVVLPRAWVRG